MSNEIIDFYKKIYSPENSNNQENELQEILSEERSNVGADIHNESVDPAFAVFLQKMAKKLTEEKVTEIVDTGIEFNTQEKSNNSIENTEFNTFLGNLTEILKKEETTKRDAIIKNATLTFIEKLKNTAYSKSQDQESDNVSNTIEENIDKEFPEISANKPNPAQDTKDTVVSNSQESSTPEEDINNASESSLPVENEFKSTTSNKYVDELKSADKVQERVKKTSSIKEIVAEQISEYIKKYQSQFPNHGFGSESGGGDNEYFFNGGTMKGNLTVNGDLNVGGRYLSGGVELSLGTGSGNTDRLTSNGNTFLLNSNGTFNVPNNTLSLQETEVLNIESKDSVLPAFTRVTLSPYGFFAYDGNSNSITFDSVENDIVLTSKNTHEWKFNSEGILQGPGNSLTVPQLCSLGKILSGTRDLADIFLTAETDSQTLTYNSTAFQLTISNGNTVTLSSLNKSNDITFVASNSANWQTAYAYVSANSVNLTAANILVNNNLTVTNTVSAKYYQGTLLDWMTLVRGYKITPTLLTSIGTGEVYTYVFATTGIDKTYYRYIATDGGEDSFYGNFTNPTLSNLIATKKITL